MFSPVRAPVDPKKWCIVVEPALEARELCHYSAVYRCSSTIHNLENQTNSPGLGLSANFLFGKIVSYNVLKNG